MFLHYLKTGWQVLLRRRFFTFVSLFGIGFTLVVLLVVTAILDHQFAPQPPDREGRRTLGVYGLAMIGEQFTRTSFPGWPFLDRHLRDLPGVEEATIVEMPERTTSFVDGVKVKSFLKRTDGAFWRVLDFDFVAGGPFTDLDVAQARPVAVVNEATKRRFFGDEGAVGRDVVLGGQRFRVVGVVADVSFLRTVAFADVWVPQTTALSDGYRDEWVGDFLGVVLLAPGEDGEAARREMARRIATAEPPVEGFDRFQGGLETPFEFLSRSIFGRQLDEAHPERLVAIFALFGLLFAALPALNLVNLNLSRILERSSEIGVRKAFGASSWTLVGQFLVENVVLTLLGAGLAFAAAMAVLAAINGSGWIPYADLAPNLRIFAWGVVLALAFAVLSGVYPAWRMSRLHPVAALRGRS